MIKKYPLDSLEGVLTRADVRIDRKITADGKGSLKIFVDEPTVVRLFVLDRPDIEDATLYFRAKVRTKDMKGRAYLEMWCRFAGRREFFSRGTGNTLSGTTGWVEAQSVFSLHKGQNPELVGLSLVMEGSGIAWVDDIRLVKGPRVGR